MMLAFVIRQCEIDLGHAPTAAELAAWANRHGRRGTSHHLFGRPISEAEARLILKRPARLVSARDAAETIRREAPATTTAPAPVVALADARARLSRRRRPERGRIRTLVKGRR